MKRVFSSFWHFIFLLWWTNGKVSTLKNMSGCVRCRIFVFLLCNFGIGISHAKFESPNFLRKMYSYNHEFRKTRRSSTRSWFLSESKDVSNLQTRLQAAVTIFDDGNNNIKIWKHRHRKLFWLLLTPKNGSVVGRLHSIPNHRRKINWKYLYVLFFHPFTLVWMLPSEWFDLGDLTELTYKARSSGLWFFPRFFSPIYKLTLKTDLLYDEGGLFEQNEKYYLY